MMVLNETTERPVSFPSEICKNETASWSLDCSHRPCISMELVYSFSGVPLSLISLCTSHMMSVCLKLYNRLLYVCIDARKLRSFILARTKRASCTSSNFE
ncbi:hypothetical protein ACB098_03G188000 [Castanea mollissima]